MSSPNIMNNAEAGLFWLQSVGRGLCTLRLVPSDASDLTSNQPIIRHDCSVAAPLLRPSLLRLVMLLLLLLLLLQPPIVSH